MSAIGSMLDWAQANGGLADKPDGVKAEFCLLGLLAAPDHACFSGLTFSNKGYEAFAHALLPGRIAKPAQFETTQGAADDVYAQAMWNGAPPTYASYSMDVQVVLAHEVMFASDFGRAIFSDSAVLARLKEASPQDGLMVYAECLMARHFMGDDVSASEIAPVEVWHAAMFPPPVWEDYHDALVAQCLLAAVGAL